jgi:hypothetical protein
MKIKFIRKRDIEEEAPVNSVGGSEIAGLGVGPKGEPGLNTKSRKGYKAKNKQDIDDRDDDIATLIRRSQPISEMRGIFAGNSTFIVPSQVFHRARLQKSHGKHWKTYIGEDEQGLHIREYAKRNKDKSIILQDENTGAMCYARYGKKK